MLAHPALAVVTGFDDLQSWSGSGANQSGLVIQWNDGKNPITLAWGFHWDNSATAYDMLTAVLHSNVGLYARIDSATAFGSTSDGRTTRGRSASSFAGVRTHSGTSAFTMSATAAVFGKPSSASP